MREGLVDAPHVREEVLFVLLGGRLFGGRRLAVIERRGDVVRVGLEDDDASREECYNTVMSRLEKRVGVADGELRKSVVVKRLYAHREFEADCECAIGSF